MTWGTSTDPAWPTVEDVAWFRVEDPSAVGTVRRAATALALRSGLDEARVAECSIVVAELASNLCKHAREGTVLLRSVRAGQVTGIEFVGVDAGPGMADLTASSRDGHSTTGTLGIGLGAITRLSTTTDAYSLPGRGTVLVARLWPTRLDPVAPPVDGLTRPISGEEVSGDAFASRVAGSRLQVMLCDGLGHGALAARAAQAAVEVFDGAPPAGPAAVVEAMHRGIRHTRGAAVAVAELDPDAQVVRFAGLGNVAGSLVSPTGPRRAMTSLPGITGHQRRTIREFTYDLDGAVVVLHSDGVTDRWDITGYPGLLFHSPLVIAATLLRDGGVRRDDASVAVAKVAP